MSDHTAAVDKEQARWQERIDEVVYARYPQRDGSGCDSGDPLDLTMTEIHGMLNHIDEQHAAALRERDEQIAAMKDAMGVRPSVAAFARRMEATLARHDAKKGGQANWRKDAPIDLMHRISAELRELYDAHASGRSPAEQAAECIDVANFCLMVYDVLVGLAEDPALTPPAQETPK